MALFELDSTKAVSANSNGIADNGEELGRNDLCIRKVADGNVLCAEGQILGTAEERICRFGAVPKTDAVKMHTAVVDISLGLIPQLAVSGQQIDRRHEAFILFVQPFDDFGKDFSVFFVFELHGTFLAFVNVLEQADLEVEVINFRKDFQKHFADGDCPCGDAFRQIWAVQLGATGLFMIVQTQAAIAVIGGVFETVKDIAAVTSGAEIGNTGHEPFDFFF